MSDAIVDPVDHGDTSCSVHHTIPYSFEKNQIGEETTSVILMQHDKWIVALRLSGLIMDNIASVRVIGHTYKRDREKRCM